MISFKNSFYLSLLGVFILLSAGAAQADASKFARSFTIASDNDSIGNLDGDYSAGLEMVWTGKSRDSVKELGVTAAVLGKVIGWTPLAWGDVDRFGSRFSIGEKMYTPRNLRSRALILDDRPYAGWAYADFSIYTQKEDVIEGLVLSLGIVGPSSYAEKVQTNVHKFFGGVYVRGWDNQLKDELAVYLAYLREEKIWDRTVREDFDMEIISIGRLSLGNVDTSVSYGLRWRGGRNLETDYNFQEKQDGRDSGFQFSYFSELKGILVGRNIFLDGNSFRESHSVDKKLALIEGVLGVDYGNERIRASFSGVYRSREFDLQKSGSRYARIALEFGY